MPEFSNSKLAKNLRLLRPDELKSFDKWLHSPWCTANKKLARLFALLQKHYPDFKHPDCQFDRLLLKLDAEKKTTPKYLRNLMAELSKQVHLFLIYQQLEQRESIKNQLLQEAFLHREQTQSAAALVMKTIKTLEKKTAKSSEDFLVLHQLYQQLYFQIRTDIRQPPDQHFLHKANQMLDVFYALTKAHFLLERQESIRISQRSMALPKDHKMMLDFTQKVDVPALQIYDEFLTAPTPISAPDFLKIKTLVFDTFDTLGEREQRIFFMTLLNMAARLRLQGADKILEEIFELYQLGLEQQLLLQDGKMTERTYNNIVTVANLLGESVFVNHFIATFTPSLETKIQLDAHCWAQAHTAYYADDFNEAINLINDHTFSSHLYNLQGRMILLQSNFDLCRKDRTYEEPFLDYCLALEKFIRRDKIFSDSRKRAYLNFIKITQKLGGLVISNNITTSTLQPIKNMLAKEEKIQARRWLMHKIKELQNVKLQKTWVAKKNVKPRCIADLRFLFKNIIP